MKRRFAGWQIGANSKPTGITWDGASLTQGTWQACARSSPRSSPSRCLLLRAPMPSDPLWPGEHIAGDVVLLRQDDYFLGLRALAKSSGLSVKTLRSHLSDPVHPLPHYRPGNKIIVRWSEFCRWLERYREILAPDVDAIVNEMVTGLATQRRKSGNPRRTRPCAKARGR